MNEARSKMIKSWIFTLVGGGIFIALPLLDSFYALVTAEIGTGLFAIIEVRSGRHLTSPPIYCARQ